MVLEAGTSQHAVAEPVVLQLLADSIHYGQRQQEIGQTTLVSTVAD